MAFSLRSSRASTLPLQAAHEHTHQHGAAVDNAAKGGQKRKAEHTPGHVGLELVEPALGGVLRVELLGAVAAQLALLLPHDLEAARGQVGKQQAQVG